jgi:hypothetical protein
MSATRATTIETLADSLDRRSSESPLAKAICSASFLGGDLRRHLTEFQVFG